MSGKMILTVPSSPTLQPAAARDPHLGRLYTQHISDGDAVRSAWITARMERRQVVRVVRSRRAYTRQNAIARCSCPAMCE